MIRLLLACAALSSLSPLIKAETQNVRLISSQFAPLQFQQQTAEGYVVELFNKLRPKLKKTYQIELGEVEFYPWKRAYQIASNSPDALFFSLSRTQQRENQFKWLAEVSPYKQAIFSLTDQQGVKQNNQIKNWQEMAQSNRLLAVQSGSHLEAHVQTHLAASQISSVPHYPIAINMLFAERVDYIPLTAFLAKGTLCRHGYASNRLNYNFDISEFANPLWAAINKDANDELVNILSIELKRLSQSIWYEDLQKQMIVDWNNRQCEQLASQQPH